MISKIFKSKNKSENHRKFKVFALNVYVVTVTLNHVVLLCKRLGEEDYEYYQFDKIDFNTDAQAAIVESHSKMQSLRVMCRKMNLQDTRQFCKTCFVSRCFCNVWKIEKLQTGNDNDWISLNHNSKIFQDN